jgi:hypothetical protein
MDTKERNGHRRLVGRPMCFTTREAELGNGMGRPDIIDERLYVQSSELQSNAKGVLFLLLSARASLLRRGADAACLRTMEDCVVSFRMQPSACAGTRDADPSQRTRRSSLTTFAFATGAIANTGACIARLCRAY